MADFTSLQKAFIRHKIAEAIDDDTSKSTTGDGRRATRTMSDKKFAELMGCHVNTLGKWKDRPDIRAAISTGIEEAQSSKDFFRLVMRQHALESLWMEYERAEEGEKRQYLRMILDQTKDVAEVGDDPVPVGDLTTEDLLNEILLQDVSVTGMTAAKLRAKVRGK